MRKEIILAIIFGVIVAAGVSFFIYRQQSLNEIAHLDTNVVSVLEDNTEPEEDTTIRILEPLDESVHTEQAIIVRGQTYPGALVVIFINDNQDIVMANDEGQFSLAVNLEPGSNLITAHIVDEENNQFYDRIVTVFTTRPLDEVLITDEELQQDTTDDTNDDDEDEIDSY